MRSLLKKKTEAAAPAVPAWHPNFRNFEQLPDTKVVRTAFFINGITILVALVLLLWFAYQEYQLYALNRQVTEWQRLIDRDRKGSDQAVAQFKKFQSEGARVNEVDAFMRSRPVLSQLLLRLGETLPENVALDSLDLREKDATLKGTVRGASDQAAGYATTYLDTLRNDPVLAQRFEDITLINVTRNPQSGRVSIELLMKLKAPDAAKKP